MRSSAFNLSILLIAIILYSCKEENSNINLKPQYADTTLIDTTYVSDSSVTPQTKMILIEDFTGVNCQNCPKAAQKIEDIQALYPNRILATAIHSTETKKLGFLDGSKSDYRTPAGKDIYLMLGLLGGIGAFPTGAVNRTIHNDGSSNLVFQSYSTWSTFVDQELTKPSIVNIYLSGSFIDTSDIYKVKVKLHYTQARSDTEAISIFLIEDHIIDLQNVSNVTDSHYVHNHILRNTFTNATGDVLNASLVKDRVFEKEYKMDIDPTWVRANCKIIAFVHRKGSYYMDILQAWQKPLL